MDYKEILKGIVNIINTTEKSDVGFTNISSYIDENCPEIKESEDERMAKHIIDIVKCKGYDAAKDENFYAAEIAWLEKQGEHRTAWSEDDERMFKNTIALIETLEDYNKAPGGFGDVKFWLKSLKERYTWKPSEEQINALDSTLHYSQVSHNSFENLNSLFNDLKKLK